MSDLSPALQAHLDQIVTTLCSIWILELGDGTKIGLTDHDAPLILDGLICAPNRSLNASDRDHRLGFAVDSGAIETVFDIPELTSDAVKNGQLDDATLTHYKVNWQDTAHYKIIAHGVIGNVKILGQGFEAEWLGQSVKLNRSTGRVFSKFCDATFGDARCGVDLSGLPDGASCPKSFAACRDQFSNSVNFRGFPYLLGDDALQASPQIGERRDGGSRYKR